MGKTTLYPKLTIAIAICIAVFGVTCFVGTIFRCYVQREAALLSPIVISAVDATVNVDDSHDIQVDADEQVLAAQTNKAIVSTARNLRFTCKWLCFSFCSRLWNVGP